ncbi:MAG: hypothetical protein ACR2NV_01790, partial [Thermoleophilaceae bacterium]
MNDAPTHHHGRRPHSHAHRGSHRHVLRPQRSEPLARSVRAGGDHGGEGHGHSHGLVDRSIRRSRAGLRAVALSLAILALTTAIQAGVYVATGSVALLADLIHNAGDALTALPLAVAFLLRSERAELGAGLAVVLATFVSAITAGVFSLERLINPLTPQSLGELAR